MAIKPKKKKFVRKKSQKKANQKWTVLISILSMTLFLFVGLAYYFTNDVNQNYSIKALVDDLSKIKNNERIVEKKIVKRVHRNTHVLVKKKTPFVERGKETKEEKKQNIPITTQSKKPKLAIIIDDVHTKKQIEALKKLKLHITPSIFPPYVLSKHSNQLAEQVKHAMIHLPMESGSKQFNTQYKTLMSFFSDEKLADRVMELRTLFPNVTYVNNHTGSVFTSNYKAMKKLYIALKMEGFIFVDSLTSTSSKVRQIAHEFGDRYIKRDIFIDNIHTVKYIHNQLRKAVKKAKKKGYAIVIGHPHKTTIQALASAKKILKDVELVYINEI